ncbi:MAG: CHASE2 domain-containing protein [Cyanothece sp. SIO2G6]|nr:CHASE2 domain-containing protein [Cyanothece sp. SIO2G6]
MQLIELEIPEGSFTEGFKVRLHIPVEGDRAAVSEIGMLPPKPELRAFYQLWYHQYEALVQDRLGIARNIAHGGDVATCEHLFQTWRNTVKQWLQSPELYKIALELTRSLAKAPLMTQLNIKLPIPSSIDDDWSLLWKLPWHTWELLGPYAHIEPILTPAIALPIPTAQRRPNTGRVLAITGGNLTDGKRRVDDNSIIAHRESIDLQDSINELKTLESIKLLCLEHPTEDTFIDALNHPQGWDILFFTGHSGMDENGGWFEINPTTKIRAEKFQLTLRNACQNGLKLVIFSSCDGVKLAQELSCFNVPTLVAMREIIPNTVAQQFIKGLIQTFTISTAPSNLATAVRSARATLEGCSGYPGSTNLPMIFQRSPQVLPTWEDLCQVHSLGQSLGVWRSLPILLTISLLVSGLVIGLQLLGWLQAPELSAYNRLMLHRPIEAPDARLLIVGADEGDLQTYGDPIPDGILAEILTILNQHHPKAIGLDLYRNIPLPPGRAEFLQELNTNPNTIAACLTSAQNVDDSIAPPESNRTDPFSGFIDFYNDDDITPSDPTLRRYLLSKNDNPTEDKISHCTTNHSFAILLIDKYLTQKVRQTQEPRNRKNSTYYWNFNGILAPHLNQNSGGYAQLDSRGYQVLINYRNTENPRIISRQINFRDVLNQSFKAEWVTDRVIIIGNVAASKNDEHHTPYGNISGPVIHAHVVSQFISAVEDQRPLISWWPKWIEYIWLFSWTSVTSITVFLLRNPVYRSMATVLIVISIWGISQTLLSWLGLWIPPISIILATFITGFSVSCFIYWRIVK